MIARRHTVSFLLPCLLLCALVLLVGSPAVGAQESEPTPGPLRLEIGDPTLRSRTVEPVLDAVVETATGAVLTPAELAGRLAATRLVPAGESHTSLEGHRAQLALIRALREAGREVVVGLEMFPADAQEGLDRWSAGYLTEPGFLEVADWYSHWGFPWAYYREIFLDAREHGTEMVALNTPRPLVRAVRERGIEGLTDDERAQMPPSIDLDSPEHLVLFKSYFDADDPIHSAMTDDQWLSMLAAQTTWDAAMAWRAVEALRERPETVMVVLVGSGHVAYGLGIERQARALGFAGEIATVQPLPVADLDGEPTGPVAASYADYLWGLSPAAEIPAYPSLGLSTRSPEGEETGPLTVLFVNPDSPAERAGFASGDALLAMDGAPLPDRRTLNRRMDGRQWGERVTFTVRRGEETLEIPVLLRRVLPAEASPSTE